MRLFSLPHKKKITIFFFDCLLVSSKPYKNTTKTNERKILLTQICLDVRELANDKLLFNFEKYSFLNSNKRKINFVFSASDKLTTNTIFLLKKKRKNFFVKMWTSVIWRTCVDVWIFKYKSTRRIRKLERKKIEEKKRENKTFLCD